MLVILIFRKDGLMGRREFGLPRVLGGGKR
jgi:hypothetical protein